MSKVSDDALRSPPLRIQEAPQSQVSKTRDIINNRLKEHKVLKTYLESLSYEMVNDTIVLNGRLPSFYLKQVLQSALQNLPGVSHIANRVDVVNSYGLSSVTTHAKEVRR